MKINSVISRQTFLFIAVAISIYFGVHGYFYLVKKWEWPWGLSLATIVLVELVFLNVFRADSYSKVSRIPVFIFGFLALIFSIALPLLSSWDDYQTLERKVTATVELTEPVYYSAKVLPALEKELEAAEAAIAPRVAERNRRMMIGKGEYSRRTMNDGTVRTFSGYEAAGWIPHGEAEKAAFRKVEDLKGTIREYLEADKTARNAYQVAKNNAVANLKAIKSDAFYGWWAFWFKVALIVFLGVASLYYMYSYSNPETKEIRELGKTEQVLILNDKDFVKRKFSDAFGTGIGKEVQIKSHSAGGLLGAGKNADQAWWDARQNIIKGSYPIKQVHQLKSA